MFQLCLKAYSTVSMNSNPMLTAKLMTHEFGHMIGMYHDGMKKCNILWGTAFDKNEVEVKKLSSLTQDVAEGHLKRMTNLQERLLSAKASKHNPIKKIEKLKTMLKNQEMRYSKKIGAIQDRKRYWEETPEKFSFILQTVSAE